MPEHIDLSPNPKSHIKMLARIGYNLNSAISDIIDNSVTAESNNIYTEIDIVDEKAVLIILDDGYDPLGDLNGDNAVNVLDIVALINIILET